VSKREISGVLKLYMQEGGYADWQIMVSDVVLSEWLLETLGESLTHEDKLQGIIDLGEVIISVDMAPIIK